MSYHRIALGQRDPYSGFDFTSYVALRLDGQGANGSTTFTDTSPSPKIVTPFDNAKISTSFAKYGTSSMSFDGTGDYLSIPHNNVFSPNSDVPRRITLEAWIYPLAYGRTIFCKRGATGSGFENTEYRILLSAGGQMTLIAWGAANATAVNIASTSLIPLNTWSHIEVSRNLTPRWQIFVNGLLEASAVESAPILGNTQPLIIGRDTPFTDRDFMGSMHVRITGHERHNINFTPPVNFNN